MRTAACKIALCAALSTGLAAVQAAPETAAGPSATASITPIVAPKDRAYTGEIHLKVDASDTSHRVMHVHETLSGVGPDTVLLYPKWLPGTHAPEGTIDRLGGIRITANGAPVAWKRDPVDVFAFRLNLKPGTHAIDIDFDYLSPTSGKVGALEMSRELMLIEWNELVFYPAGYFARQIPAEVELQLPVDWQFGSALETASTDHAQTRFKRTTLETLIDSPLYAGRYASKLDLDPGAAVPVHMDLFADRPELLALKPEHIEAYRNLVRQAYKLYGSHHYNHYDFLYSLSDQIQQNGLEHHQSSEDGSDPDSFTKWDKEAFARDSLHDQGCERVNRPWINSPSPRRITKCKRAANGARCRTRPTMKSSIRAGRSPGSTGNASRTITQRPRWCGSMPTRGFAHIPMAPDRWMILPAPSSASMTAASVSSRTPLTTL